MPPVPDITLCMIVRNEERQLSHCLDSVSALNPELIIVDTGSSDETPRLAADYGARVIPFDFSIIDFAAARNHSLAHATGRWILVLDADETLHLTGIPIVTSILAANRNAGYFLERYNHSAHLPTCRTDHVVRLFPNHPSHRYRGRVHETVDASILRAGGQLLESSIRIDHAFALDPVTRRSKSLRYIDVLQQEIAADPTDTSRLDFLAAEYHQLENYEEAARIAERIARLRPHDARAHLFAGTYHLLFKPDLAQAQADFTRALELKPDYPEARLFLRLLREKECARNTPLTNFI